MEFYCKKNALYNSRKKSKKYSTEMKIDGIM